MFIIPWLSPPSLGQGVLNETPFHYSECNHLNVYNIFKISKKLTFAAVPSKTLCDVCGFDCSLFTCLNKFKL